MRTRTKPSDARGGRSKPRGAYAKTDETQLTILEAALVVFATKGFHGGSLRDIAREVSISEGKLLYHFPNKAALLTGVLDLRDQKSNPLVPFDHPDPHRVLLGLVDLARYNAGVPGLVQLHSVLSGEATSPEHPAHAYFARRYDYYVTHLTTAFERCAELGTLRAGVEPAVAGRSTVAVQDGLQIQWLLGGQQLDLPAEVELHLRRFVHLDRNSDARVP